MKPRPSLPPVWPGPVGINLLIGACLVAALAADGVVDLVASAVMAVVLSVAVLLLPMLYQRRVDRHARKASTLPSKT